MVLRACTAVIRYVASRSTWATVLLWLLLWPLLVPAWIIVRTDGSRGGKITAGAVALGVLILGILPSDATDPSGPDRADTSIATAPRTARSPAATASPTPRPSPSSQPSPTASPTPASVASPTPEVRTASASPRGDDAPVVLMGRPVEVVDGDTIDLADGTRVRLAIADTPEVHGGVEPCGREAAQFTASYVAGVTVAIYRPTGAPATDRYGRLVGEVVRVTDGGSLNVALVAAGLATVDGRFTSEDPDLARRLEIAAEQAPTPACAG